MAYKRKFAKRRWGKKATRKPYAKKRSLSFAKRVKRVVMKTAEPKSKVQQTTTIQLLHNVNSNYHLNQQGSMPGQGVSDTQRVGDQIHATKMEIRLFLTQKNDRPNCNWRISVVSVPKGSTYTYGDWYRNSLNVIPMDQFNMDFVKKVHYDKVFKNAIYDTMDAIVGGASVAREYTKFMNITIPYKKTIKFGPGDGGVATPTNTDDLHILVSVFDAAGTLITDNIGAWQMQQELYYRDP